MGELVAARRRQGLPERPSAEQLAEVGRILGEARQSSLRSTPVGDGGGPAPTPLHLIAGGRELSTPTADSPATDAGTPPDAA